MDKHASFFSRYPGFPEDLTNYWLYASCLFNYADALHVAAATGHAPDKAQIHQALGLLESLDQKEMDSELRNRTVTAMAELYLHLAQQSEGKLRRTYSQKARDLASLAL